MSNTQYSVMVVEDEKMLAKSICRNIERANSHFKVTATATNGEDALNIIDEALPNVVFTDIQMPAMNGLELARKIHSNYNFIPCVIISGHSDFSYAQEAIEADVVDYLLKPINFSQLQKVLLKIEQNLIASHEELRIAEANSFQKPEEIIELIVKYIHKHYSDILDLTAISNEFGFSVSYLTKIFKKHTGQTPSKYIRDYRIGIARQLLRQPDFAINKIAESVGYPDQFHFSKTFKLVTGMSPTDYRAAQIEEE